MSPYYESMESPTGDTRLVPATSSHFDWAIAGADRERSFEGLRLPPGGLDSTPILSWLKRTARFVDEQTRAHCAWIIVSGSEAVGLISYKAPPADGVVEIGYGVAASRRARGHATRAVALVVREAAHATLSLSAKTAIGNRPSQIVLERNGFVRVGTEISPDDGELVLWHRERDAVR